MKRPLRTPRAGPYLVVGLLVALLWGASSASAAPVPIQAGTAPPGLVEQGSELFATGCSSCHGLDGKGAKTDQGKVRGPSVVNAGEAAAYYQLSTGRMPLAASGDNPVRKDPAYGPSEIDSLVAYVGSLGSGPPIPEVNPSKGDLADGGVLFRQNCQACHSATGAGGALSYGRAAPSLGQSTATQVGAAMRSGPGQMPVFDPQSLSPDDVDSIARYVQYLERPEDPGGLSLGRLGPIPEGFLVWVFGLGVLLIVCVWIGGRNRDRKAVPDQ